MKKDFEAVIRRAVTLRLTELELVALIDPPMSYATYWRAKTGTTGLQSQVKVLRRVEATLDQLEREKDARPV